MLRVTLVILASSACLIRFVSPVEAESRSVSPSRQFIVYGPDAQVRGALCDLAERTKATALLLLHEKDEWRTPIVVNARFPQAHLPELPSAHLNFSQTGSGLKLQLDLTISADVSAPAVERDLLRAIYLEMIYRPQPDIPAGTAFVEPPDWLLDGTMALGNGRDPASLSRCLRTAATTGGIVTLREFLQQRPGLLESPSRTIHRAYASALVALLTTTPDGRMRLARFVADLPHASNDPFADVQAHFPALGDSSKATEKTWRHSVAQFSLNEPFQLLDCGETERQLVGTLHVAVSERDRPMTNYSLEEFPKFISLPASREALKGLTRDLLALSGRANPLYVPVIFEYDKIAALLARRKTKRITERLAVARAMREEIGRTMQEIDDYMNWFEATQFRTASGAFSDYLKAAEFALDAKLRRHDPISVYLDAFEPLVQH
jgi:hypothetical protein